MMNTEELLILILDAAKGKDDIKKGALGFNGYGFIFKDEKNSKENYVNILCSGKFADAGAYRGITEKALQLEKVKHLNELLSYEEKYDCLFAGSLKTLIPTLEFGGDEILFYVWMFVKTPDGKQFPATFYFGPSGTSLGGWRMDEYEGRFPEDFIKIINFSPFDLSKNDREGLIEALESVLRKVPIADFHAVYHHDLGNVLMGVRGSEPFIMELGYEYNEEDIEICLDILDNKI